MGIKQQRRASRFSLWRDDYYYGNFRQLQSCCFYSCKSETRKYLWRFELCCKVNICPAKSPLSLSSAFQLLSCVEREWSNVRLMGNLFSFFSKIEMYVVSFGILSGHPVLKGNEATFDWFVFVFLQNWNFQDLTFMSFGILSGHTVWSWLVGNDTTAKNPLAKLLSWQ